MTEWVDMLQQGPLSVVFDRLVDMLQQGPLPVLCQDRFCGFCEVCGLMTCEKSK